MEFETDITGYGRKMGLDARLTPEGRIDAVVKVGDGDFDGMQRAGTVPVRTMNPGGTEAAGGAGILGDYAPTYGRDDGVTGNPRGPPDMNDP